jgi:hypothetical protein
MLVITRCQDELLNTDPKYHTHPESAGLLLFLQVSYQSLFERGKSSVSPQKNVHYSQAIEINTEP